MGKVAVGPRRAIPGVEKVEDDCYARTIRLRSSGRDLTGCATVGNDAEHNRLTVTVSAPPLPPPPRGAGGSKQPGTRVPGINGPSADSSMLVSARATHGAGAPRPRRCDRAASRTARHHHCSSTGDSRPGRDDGVWGHRRPPPPRPHGDVASGPGSNARDLHEPSNCGFRVEIPGIGAWTAGYIAMRCLAWPDAFLATDLEVRKALRTPSPGKILTLAERWKPWRAYAVMHLWNRAEAESVSDHSAVRCSPSLAMVMAPRGDS